jgi:hypothetical protein
VTGPRTRLEQLAGQANLSIRDFTARFHQAGREIDEEVHVSERQAKRWLSGAADMPRPAARRVLEHWWKTSTEALLAEPIEVHRPIPMTGRELLMVTRKSTDHAIASAAALDPDALEHLHAEVRRLARAHLNTTSAELLADLVVLRDNTYAQLDRTNKPAQQAELYLIAGQTCGLLSTVAWDLGHPDIAEAQARAAHTYGNVIAHASLKAWARGLQVTWAFWSGRLRRGVSVAEAALPTAPAGTTRVRLHSVHARSLALIGAREEAETALNAARDELDRDDIDPMIDVIGGEPLFGRDRHAVCAASVYVALGDGVQAEQAALTALGLFEAAGENRWTAAMLCVRVDLAIARTLRGDLSGTEAALSPVFDLIPSSRTDRMVRRAHDLGRLVAGPRFRDSVDARRLGERIEAFTTVARTAIES